MTWINAPLADILLRKKHTLPILITLYAHGAAGTSALVLHVHGHPHAVITAIRTLEQFGVIRRRRLPDGRHEMETTLTLRGLLLIETPVCRWQELIRKWDRLSE